MTKIRVASFPDLPARRSGNEAKVRVHTNVEKLNVKGKEIELQETSGSGKSLSSIRGSGVDENDVLGNCVPY